MAAAICLKRLFEISPLQVGTARLLNSWKKRDLSSRPLLKTDYNEDGDVVTLTLNRPPVNSFSMDFMEGIIQALKTIEDNKKCRGVIITSDIPNVFCAGLDLKEVLQSDKNRLVVFRRTFQEMWSRLYGSRLVTMAAIKGHAIAGGCVLSLACDMSIMAAGYRIGLPELALGLYLAPWMCGTLINAVGLHTAEKIIYTAQVFSAEKAAEIGLVHCVVPPDKVMMSVHEEMAKQLSMELDESRQATKKYFRKDLLELLNKTKEEDIELFVSTVTNESTRKQIQLRLEQLQTKTKA